MVTNPFIALYDRPVETLTLAGYVLLLVFLTTGTLALLYNNILSLRAQWVGQRRRWAHPYAPPLTFQARVLSIPFVLFIDALLSAAIIYLVT